MGPVVSPLKIRPPKLSRVFPRPRLLSCLEKNGDKKLVVILGQAAQGKSTLAASYLAASAAPTAWLNLGREDSDPVDLFYSIVHSLQAGLKVADLSSLFSYPALAMAPRLELPLYREWANAIYEKAPIPFHLVFDGLDRLLEGAPSFEFIRVLTEHAPPRVRLFLISREEPPLGVASLTMKQEALVLTNEDLAFHLDEVKAFFRGRGLTLHLNALKKIYSLTGGWTGGLIIMAEILERLPEGMREGYLEDGIPDRVKGEVFRYFGEEIFSYQPPHVQEFLIKTSVLESVESDLARDFFDREDAADVLAEPARKNLFVQWSPHRSKGSVFRYHPLFHSFLRSKLAAETTEAERRSLHLKAGELYEIRGASEKALEHYLEAKALDRAAEVLERVGMELFSAGRTADLARRLKELPEEAVQQNPRLLLYLSLTRRFTGAGENMASLEKALALFEARGDTGGVLLALAFLLEASIVRGFDDAPVSELIRRAEGLLNALGPDEYKYERAALLFQMGFAMILRGGQIRRGCWACKEAYLIAKDLGNVALQIYSLLNAVNGLSILGEFALVDENCALAESLLEDFPSPELRTIQGINFAQTHIARGENEKARDAVRTAMARVEEYGLIYLYPVTLLYDLMASSYLGDYKGAEETGGQLLSLLSSIGNVFLSGAAWMFLGFCAYRKGDFHQAEERLARAESILSERNSRAEIHLHMIGVVKGLLALHGGDGGGIEQKVLRSLLYFEEVSDHLFQVDAHFTLALLKWKGGEKGGTVSNLESGFRIIQQKGFSHLMLLSGEDVMKVCALALELEVKSCQNEAALLAGSRTGVFCETELRRLARHPKRSVRSKAHEIRKAALHSKGPPLRIETFGGFRVFRGDEPMPEKDWLGKQPKTLLRAILARGIHKVGRDTLMDDLWGGEPSQTVERNFKVALHRLRKSLEPRMDKSLGSRYIRMKHNAVSLDKNSCEVDVARFESLIREGGERERKGDRGAAVFLYEKAIAIYRGEFLPGDLYSACVATKRDELKRKHLTALLKAAKYYEGSGASTKAMRLYRKAVQTDPLSEESYQELMLLYSRKGKRNEALKVFESCKEALRKGLDTDPDPVTLALYKKLIAARP